jgi:hypothetical protein
MTDSQIDAEVACLIAELPAVPQPWSINKLCKRLAAQRDRELLLHPLRIPALPFGLWYDDGQRDHIIYRAEVSGYHRDHIILHEICHMLGKHRIADRSVSGRERESRVTLLARLVEYAAENPHTDEQEEVGEAFAARVLNLSKRTPLVAGSDFERRAAVIFGA